MAKKDKDEEIQLAEGEETGKKGGLKKIIILVLAVLLLVGASIGGTLFATGFFDPKPEETEEAAAAEIEEEEQAPAQYYQIKPSFIVNYQSHGRQRYLKVDVAMMTRDDDVYAAFDEHAPLIKSRMLAIFGAEVYEDMQTHEGKELLRQKILKSLSDTMAEETGKKGVVEQVLFTNFVMQ